eukprot:3796767-Amphidinium_carterae.3
MVTARRFVRTVPLHSDRIAGVAPSHLPFQGCLGTCRARACRPQHVCLSCICPRPAARPGYSEGFHPFNMPYKYQPENLNPKKGRPLDHEPLNVDLLFVTCKQLVGRS